MDDMINTGEELREELRHLEDEMLSQALAVNEFPRITAGGAYDPEEDDEFPRGYFQALENSSVLVRSLLNDQAAQPSREIIDYLQSSDAQYVADRLAV